jgi:ligand-binding SRPBCC domain-containing protein
MAFYQLEKTQIVPSSIEKVWEFISSPGNLKKITPEYLRFDITSRDLTEKTYPGMIICYKVSPMFGIKMNWLTEITHVRDKEYFVDEQRVGPYAFWHHQHKLEAIDQGVLMTDLVTYQPPFGLLGAIANSLFIKKQLKEIFDFRTVALERRFGKKEEGDG